VQFGIGPLQVSPQLRYTRWNSGVISVPQPLSFALSENQVDILVGISWKVL
jgi:hypothetical protein